MDNLYHVSVRSAGYGRGPTDELPFRRQVSPSPLVTILSRFALCDAHRLTAMLARHNMSQKPPLMKLVNWNLVPLAVKLAIPNRLLYRNRLGLFPCGMAILYTKKSTAKNILIIVKIYLYRGYFSRKCNKFVPWHPSKFTHRLPKKYDNHHIPTIYRPYYRNSSHTAKSHDLTYSNSLNIIFTLHNSIIPMILSNKTTSPIATIIRLNYIQDLALTPPTITANNILVNNFTLTTPQRAPIPSVVRTKPGMRPPTT